jgi:hypothetical protein
VTVMLERLAALRRQREQRALEALAVQTSRLRQAEQQATDAARAVQDHIRDTQGQERALIGTMAGQPVSITAILRIQLELDGAIREMARRRAAETEAQADVQIQQNTRAARLADFQSRQRASSKIDLLNKEEHARQARRDSAITDADAEDRNAAATGTAAVTIQLNTIQRNIPRGVS